MQIGARLSSFGIGEKWENPYVTDGLVAMWDGEWNNGVGGSHSDTVTSWKDLIVGYELKSGRNKGATNTFPTVGAKSMDFVADSGISCPFSGKVSTGSCTFEFVTKYTVTNLSGNVGVAGPASCSETGSTVLYDICGFRGSGYLAYMRVANIQGVMFKFANYVNSLAKIDITSDGTNGYTYVNGTKVGSVSGFSVYYSQIMAIGKMASLSEAGFIGKVYGARVYNRVLSANEMKTNYTKDVERFSAA